MVSLHWDKASEDLYFCLFSTYTNILPTYLITEQEFFHFFRLTGNGENGPSGPNAVIPTLILELIPMETIANADKENAIHLQLPMEVKIVQVSL